MTINEIKKVNEFLAIGEELEAKELEAKETKAFDELQTLLGQVMKNSDRGIMADGRGDNND